MIYLIVTRGSQGPKRKAFSEFPVLGGRDPFNHMVLEDTGVEPFHFRIKKRDRIHVFEDLTKDGKSYINGNRAKNALLKNGDKILIGETELLFVSTLEELGFSKEIAKFDLIVDDTPHSISSFRIDGEGEVFNQKTRRFDPLKILNQFSKTSKNRSLVYEIYSDLVVLPSLEEMIRALLVSSKKLCQGISRGVFFLWSEDQKKLNPLTERQFEEPSKPFLVGAPLFREIIGRKQGLFSESHQTNGPRYRLALPLLNQDRILGVFYAEYDGRASWGEDQKIESLQMLFNLCGGTIESKILRKDWDHLLLGTVETLVAAIGVKDTYTLGHSERVCAYSMAIADEMRLDRSVKKLLMISALCHDVGKIGIPDAVLKKASLLSPEEYEEMKLHPSIGSELIEHIPGSQRFLSGIRYHHEKWDGTGYPEGLVGENIPFFGRIVAVADVFDAMISGRSYSGFIDEGEAVERMQKEIELFDPEIVYALVRSWERGGISRKTSTVGGK